MEVSESNAIFESLNLNPQLFINEVLNFVDDLTDEAFNYFLEEASAQMKTEGTDRSADLSRNPSSADDLSDLDTLADTELDAQLNSLRDKLTLVGKESTDLRKELLALEKQSLSSNQCAGSVKEALQLYEKQATTKTLQELATTALEFRSKLEKLNRRSMDEIQSIRAKRLRIPQEDMFQMNLGLFNGKLDDLQQFLDEI
ncbi:MIS12 homolog isoform X2 [Olea europaea subsp. europaea]|uniref:MIS12 homolog isoform X2 n=1 Tax=Olea europaea subsp. europaea TaxID=158383 RepID=A0A8S0RJD3_OLEEU|nr:MIS12 homolog isoform X2 [Olea europaea subsp. europaea]